MSNPKRIPITRMNKFFSEEDFKLELEMGREYVESDLNFKVILFRVDKHNTTVDDLYGESYNHEIRFHPPTELYVIPSLAAPENKQLNKGNMRINQHGNLTFGIYQQQLDELAIDIEYGDYIGYAENETTIKYYTVSNDGRVNADNAHTLMGVKGIYRTVVCVPVDDNEFTAI